MTRDSEDVADEQPEPLKLEYRSPSTPDPVTPLPVDDDFVDLSNRRWRWPTTPGERFTLGFVGGIIGSGIFRKLMFFGPMVDSRPNFVAAVTFVLGKFAVAMILIGRRNWGITGLGILLSMGIGGLCLFSVTCGHF
jgi:hypothetical protein